jgi:conjugal transfer pilus assembly protein TraU
LDAVQALSIKSGGARDAAIVYTALHGVGDRLVRETMKRAGFSNVHSVAQQAEPDGEFPTVAFPNPEEKGALDLAYLTELDPLWADDELTAILNPEALLFANAPAKAACAADCVAATAGMPLPKLFWCGGCQGSLYPMNGHVAAHIGGVQASTLISQRMTAKMHRQFLTFDGAGSRGLCGYYAEPVMDKTHYKLQMVYPVPATNKINGQCCQPYGRSTALWGAGKSFPVTGEDFSYQIFRKRNCCASVY